MLKLWYKVPAAVWEAALPLGNGRLGAMVNGGIDNEILQLNEATLWAGGPEPAADRQDAYTYLPKIRELIRSGNYSEAEGMIVDHFSGFGGPDLYQRARYTTLGEIKIEQKHAGEAANYTRSLNLETACAQVNYSAGGVTFARETFISAPAQVIVSHYTADKPGALSMNVSLARPFCETVCEGNDLVMTGTAAGETDGPMKVCARLRVVARGGSVAANPDGTLTVSTADEVVLLLAAGTDYTPDPDRNYQKEAPDLQVRLTLDALCQGNGAFDYEAWKAAHIADYRSYFDRVSLHLGEGRDDLPTDERLLQFEKDPNDPGLVELYYQFGRYLLISCSRPDNMLPANLQGIWNKDMHPAWEADFHTNINLQMNYWPAGNAGLIECMEPFARFVETLAKRGGRSAKAYWNANGWTVNYTSNAFHWTSPGWGMPWGLFHYAGAWLCAQLFEYYAFTQDEAILERIYPVIRENCVFNMETLIRDEDGYLVTSPSASPENVYATQDGRQGWVCEGCSMDIEILWECFTAFLELGRIRGYEKDAEFLDRVRETRDNLRPLRIGSAGQLQEWSGDWDMTAPQLDHRHVSHLFGLHPGTMISPDTQPELAEAAKTTLAYRGDEGTGWSLGWKINFRARLYDGDHAYEHIKRILRFAGVSDGVVHWNAGSGTYANLFDAHPPFQIDGNFGACAGIGELLVQSHRRLADGTFVIVLLPALPKTFADGSVTGLGARGAFTVDITWTNCALCQAVIHAKKSRPCALAGTYSVTDRDGKAVPASYHDGLTVFDAVAGGIYTVRA